MSQTPACKLHGGVQTKQEQGDKQMRVISFHIYNSQLVCRTCSEHCLKILFTHMKDTHNLLLGFSHEAILIHLNQCVHNISEKSGDNLR